MKIMTYNVQHFEDYTLKKIDYKKYAEVINNFDADIIGFNEVRGEGPLEGYENQMDTMQELTGYEYAHFSKSIDVRGENPYGNAFMSKYKIISTEKFMIPDTPLETRSGTHPYETRSVLKVKLENGLTVIISHFGLNHDEQVNAVETVMGVLEDEKCILMGDFNTTPEDPVFAPIRAKMKDTADLFAQPLVSFPADNPVEKIDYIFVSTDIEVVSADIPDLLLSDHRPYVAEVNLK